MFECGSRGDDQHGAWPTHGRTANASAGRQLRRSTLEKSGNCIVLASAKPRSPAGYESDALRFAGS